MKKKIKNHQNLKKMKKKNKNQKKMKKKSQNLKKMKKESLSLLDLPLKVDLIYINSYKLYYIVQKIMIATF